MAIDGGSPVRSRRLPYGRQSIDDADIESVVSVLRSDYLTTGPKVEEFEESFARSVGARYAVAVSSGTAALHAAAFAFDLGPGTETVTTPMTFAATANSVRYQGGDVVFADVRPDTLNIALECAEAAVTNRTRAVIAVDFAGQPTDLDGLSILARRRGLALIEDACHALGATYRGRPIGSVADATIFSLHPVKHITTGEGGVLTTNDSDVAARARRFRSHGIDADALTRERAGSWFYEMAELGYNYRLTDLQCALGLSQLKKLPGWVKRRRAIAARYEGALKGLPTIDLPTVLPDREHAWHLYAVRIRPDRLRTDRAGIFRALQAENIGVNVHYIPVPWHPYYQRLGFRKGDWPVAESAYERLISLPMFPAMTDLDVDDVIAAVKKVFSHYAL